MNNEKKYQVFISSTFIDLQKERQAAVEAILSVGHIPAGMELFAATNTSQWEVIKKWIDASDVYMVILGARYGTVNSETQLSYTHMEYEYALSTKKPLFAIVINDKNIGSLPNAFVEQDNKEALADFRNLVSQNMVSFYSDTKDIENAIFRSLNTIRQEHNLIGWVKGDQYDPNIAKELARVSEEARRLREENQNLKEKLIQRIPDLSLILNDDETFNLTYSPKGISYYSNPSPITDIPKHLKEYTDERKVQEYNQIIEHNTTEKIQAYNLMLDRVHAYEHLSKVVVIKLANLGTAIANNVEITIKFPDFIKVFEDTEGLNRDKVKFIKESEKIIKPLIQNPLDIAQKELAAKSFYKQMGIANTINSLGLSRLNAISPIETLNTIKISNINPAVSIIDNIVRLRYSKLLHTKYINESITILPIAIGEGVIQISIHCEEYLKPHALELPIEVK